MVTFELLEIPAPAGMAVITVAGAFRCDRSRPMPRIVGAIDFLGHDPGRAIDAKILHAYIPSRPFVAEMPEYAARAGQAAWARLPVFVTGGGGHRDACPFSVSGEPTFVDAVPVPPG